MCNPVQEEQGRQQTQMQAQIVVQTDRQEAAQMQEQTVQQMQQQQQPAQQVQQPAAPIDAAPTQTQHKRTKEIIAPMSRHQARDNDSAFWAQTFHDTILENAKLDMEFSGSKEYTTVMKAIIGYASMNLATTSTDEQSAALAKARKLLSVYLGSSNAIPEEVVRLDRYRLYFDTFADGYLKLPQDMEKVSCVDYSQKEVELPPIKMGITPSWVDVSDQPLFAHEPCVNDIQQRLLGDCYLQAAISSFLLKTPIGLKECLRDNGDGTVTVRFFQRKYDVLADLPAYYQRKAAETDPMRLSDQDLLVRLLIHWGIPAQEQQLKQAYADKITSAVTSLHHTPDVEKQMDEFQKEMKLTQTREERDRLYQQVQQYLHDIEQQAKKGIGLEYLLGQIDLDHIPQAEALVAQICAYPEFAPTLAVIQQARQDGGNVMDVLSRIIHRFEGIGPLVERLKTEKQELVDALYDRPAMHPVYVTVKKTVPRLVGVDTYAANSLWMQMIEKAYAASGLHIEDVETRVQGTRSYAQIEGGYGDKFLETLTGIPAQRVTQTKITPMRDIASQPLRLVPLFDTTEQRQMAQQGIDATACAAVQSVLQHELERRLLRSYSPIGKEPIRYAVAAITIEDMREIIVDWRNWEQEDARALLREMQLEDAGIDEQMRKIADYLETYYDNLDIPGFEHRRFAQNADDTPKYTRWALQQYDAIQQALQDGKPVSVGTHEFIPKEVQGHGWNGESKEGGLVQGHAYSVVGCKEIDGRKCVTLRNPWANFERQYVKVTETDGRVHYEIQEIKQGIFAQSDTSGTFRMELNDFMGSVDAIYSNE